MKKLIFPIIAISLIGSSCSDKKEEKEVHNKVDEIVVETVDTILPAPEMPEGWELTENEEIKYAGILDSVTMFEMPELSDKFAKMYGEISAYLGAKQIEMAGAPLSHWSQWDTAGTSVFDAGIPIVDDIKGNDHVVQMSIPAGKAVKYIHKGRYDDMLEPYTSINVYFAMGGLKQTGGPWEVYVTDPTTEPDTSEWITEIWFPVEE